MSVNVPKTLYAELEELAKASGLKVSTYARDVLVYALETHARVLKKTTVRTRRKPRGKNKNSPTPKPKPQDPNG